VEKFRKHLERLQEWSKTANPYWFGDQVSFHDAYCFTLLRWGGYAGIDPDSVPQLKAYVERVMQAPPVAAALERERVKLDTYQKAG
jgi:glutathione S-transferase